MKIRGIVLIPAYKRNAALQVWFAAYCAICRCWWWITVVDETAQRARQAGECAAVQEKQGKGAALQAGSNRCGNGYDL
jgi:hypothetical protein